MHCFDCHVHSTFSADAESGMEELCEAADRLGLSGLIFTEHVDFDPADPLFSKLRYKEYREEIERCKEKFRNRLIIKAGAEISYNTIFQEEIKEFLDENEFDYILGSVHLIDHVFVGDPEYFSGKNEDAAYEPFWEETLNMIKTGWFKYVGHMDYVTIKGRTVFGSLNLQKWKDKLTSIMEGIFARDIILEVNTAGIRKGLGEPLPGWDLLRLYKEFGGRWVVMGSDAHRIEDVGAYFPETADRLRKMGLEIITEF